MKRIFGCVAILGVLLSAACASAGKARAECGLQPGDSTFAGITPVYRDCAVDSKARLLTDRVTPDYRPQEAARRNACYSGEIMFVVDTLGRPETSTVKVVHQTNPEFGAALVAMLPRLRYEPARLNGRAVRQITTEKRSLSAIVVAVPAGSGPPSASQVRGQMPRC